MTICIQLLCTDITINILSMYSSHDCVCVPCWQVSPVKKRGQRHKKPSSEVAASTHTPPLLQVVVAHAPIWHCEMARPDTESSSRSTGVRFNSKSVAQPTSPAVCDTAEGRILKSGTPPTKIDSGVKVKPSGSAPENAAVEVTLPSMVSLAWLGWMEMTMECQDRSARG